MTPEQEKFLARVDRSGDCWVHMGKPNREGGHVQIKVAGVKVGAHRRAYELFVGPIPEGAMIRHTCDNPPCVNPAHLLPGSAQDNMDDKMTRGRHRAIGGQSHYMAKLTDAEVAEIRALAGVKTQTEIARMYGTSQPVVSNIINGKRRVAA